VSATLRPLARLLVESAAAETGALPIGVTGTSASELDRAGVLHRVRPAIRRRIAGAAECPPSWCEPLESARRGQILRHLQALHDLGVLAPEFENAGVRWAVSKGPVLADVVWPHPDMREYTDLDILVHPADFAMALRTLERLHFALVDRNWPEIHRLGRAELAMRGPSGLPLDLHWDIAVAPHDRRVFRADLPGMLERVRRVRLGNGVEVPALDATDTLLHVGIHAALSGANRLMWIADVHFSAGAADVDWSALEDRLVRARMSAPVAVVLGRAERTFGERFPVSDALRRVMSGSLPARIASRREARHPFPGLPDDPSLSGAEYSAARDGAARTIATLFAQWAEVRRIEARVDRHGTPPNPLDHDVPDEAARRRYLATVVREA
jgi:hypothetical protein